MSEQAKHTPGPWATNGYHVWGPEDPRSKHKNGRVLIGGVVDNMNDWRGRPCDSADDRAEFAAERIANANLIAAAPDMLAALEAMTPLAENNTDDTEKWQRAISAAKAAIAKVKGGGVK